MAKRKSSPWWKSGSTTNRSPEATQEKYDRSIQRLMSPHPSDGGRGMWVDGIFVPADADAVEFTQPGPRRPGR